MSSECHTVSESPSNSDLFGIYKTKAQAKRQAKAKMRSYGGRWSVGRCEFGYFDAHEQYFIHHNVKPVWVGKKWQKMLFGL